MLNSPPPLISCVVPVFNGARFIGKALQSILLQSHPVAEIVVVDDGSRDELDASLAIYGPSIELVRQSNLGPAAARNHGVRVAKGEFLAFLDADDVWHPDKIARQMARFAARPELQLCLCMQRPFWEPEMRHEETRLRAEGHLFAKDHAGYVCQAMLMPRATFELVGEFNEALRVGEDTDWLIRAKECAVTTEMLDEVLFYRRMHGSNLSTRAAGEVVADRLDFLVQHLRRKRGQRREK